MCRKHLRLQIANICSRIRGGTKIQCACENYGIHSTDGVGRSTLPMIHSKIENGGL
jgi:hypothetical protein